MPKREETETVGTLSVPIEERLARLRSLVEALPEGDEDREDLILLFSELGRLKKQIVKMQRRRHRNWIRREENKRLCGALSLAKYGLQLANRRIKEQQITIGWLCRRLKRGEKLQEYEHHELKSILKEQQA